MSTEQTFGNRYKVGLKKRGKWSIRGKTKIPCSQETVHGGDWGRGGWHPEGSSDSVQVCWSMDTTVWQGRPRHARLTYWFRHFDSSPLHSFSSCPHSTRKTQVFFRACTFKKERVFIDFLLTGEWEEARWQLPRVASRWLERVITEKLSLYLNHFLRFLAPNFPQL